MDSWMRYSLGYICEDNDIDLVLTGHDSVYSRSAFTNRRCENYEGYDYADVYKRQACSSCSTSASEIEVLQTGHQLMIREPL